MRTLLRILILAGIFAIALGAKSIVKPAQDGPFPPDCLPPQNCAR